MFKVAIIGNNEEKDYSLFEKKCIYYLKNRAKEGIIINTIGDDLTNKFASKYHIEMNVIIAKWSVYGKNTLKYRNEELLKDVNAVIIFDDKTKSNRVIRDLASLKNIPYRIIS